MGNTKSEMITGSILSINAIGQVICSLLIAKDEYSRFYLTILSWYHAKFIHRFSSEIYTHTHTQIYYIYI